MYWSNPVLSLAAVAALLVFAPVANSSPDSPALQSRGPRVDYARLPLAFGPSAGIADKDLQFVARGNRYAVFLSSAGIVLKLDEHGAPTEMDKKQRLQRHTTQIRVHFLGAARIAGVPMDLLPGIANYFAGKSPDKWQRQIPQYARVRYSEIYPGIDVVYYGTQTAVEYDFEISPGADVGALEIEYEGATSVDIASSGELLLSTMGGSVVQHKPLIYQIVDGRRVEIAGGYLLRGERRVGFSLGSYDGSRPLIIDPVLSYSTFIGGGGFDFGTAVAVDSDGNAYVTGSTSSTNFPVSPGAPQPSHGATSADDAFVIKLNASGSAMLYSSFFGGAGGDAGYGIAVDSNGSAYVAGFTASPDFPTTSGAFQTGIRGSSDAFVLKLSPDGSRLEYSTLIGGNSHEVASAIAVDAFQNAYVTGYTQSTDFPGTLIAPSRGGPADAFVSKLSADGRELIFSSRLGGTSANQAQGIAVDALGQTYVTGFTNSIDFPVTTDAFQSAFSGGTSDAFFFKLSSSGTSLLYSTYLGGGNEDQGTGIAVGPNGNAFVTGYTSSPDFPVTVGALQSAIRAPRDAFVTKFSASGNALDYSTYIGGNGNDESRAIAIDHHGNAYITGSVGSTDFPVTLDAFQPANSIPDCTSCNSDAFVSALSADGRTLLYSTYLGGPDFLSDSGYGLATDENGGIYVAGVAGSRNQTVSGFPVTPGAFQPSFNYGYTDGFLAKFADVAPASAITIDRRAVDFGSQAINTTGPQQPIVITNRSTTTISITSVTTSPEFPASHNCTTLSPSASCTAWVAFRPGLVGVRNGAVVVSSATEAHAVALVGNRAAASMAAGACGSAHGLSSASAPSANLCAIGSPSAVNGTASSWTWRCAGPNNGAVASCWAPKGALAFAVKGRTQPGALVTLRKLPDLLVTAGPTVADADGFFLLTGIPKGEWTVSATLAGYLQDCGSIAEGNGPCTVTIDRDIDIAIRLDAVSSGKNPILLIPGVMGSTVAQQYTADYGVPTARRFSELTMGRAPQLPKDRCALPPAPCELRHKLEIYDPPLYEADILGDPILSYTALGSAKLISALEDAGYRVFPTPWDWREPLDRAYRIFLRPKIEEVKRRTGAAKVDIVAHSMGGLVARAYIQSSDYQNDVGRLVMVGTPNSGSTNAYYLMKGGDPLALDHILATFLPKLTKVAFYTAAVAELWRVYHDDNELVTEELIGSGVSLVSRYRLGHDLTTARIRAFLEANVPGGNDLLPTYDFLRAGSSQSVALERNAGMNASLAALNAAPGKARLIPMSAAQTLANQVPTKLVLSHSERSLFSVGYTGKGISTYPDGIPNGFITVKPGDGTVLRDEARAPFDESWSFTCEGSWGTHSAMIGEARDAILGALKTGNCYAAPPAAVRSKSEPLPTTIASYSTRGDFALLLTAPDGKSTGSGYGRGEILQEIPSSSVHVSEHIDIIKQESPTNGNYVLTVSGDPALVNVAARVTAASFDPAKGQREEAVRVLMKATPYSIPITVGASADVLVRIADAVAPPLGLAATPQGGATKLDWSAPADPTIAGYRIYARSQGSEAFSLLGQTTLPTFSSGIAWAPSFEGRSEFVVVSINDAGGESLVRSGNSTFNETFARAAFTAVGMDPNGTVVSAGAAPLLVSFLDQSSGTSPITQWAWDFNGDGITDSTSPNPAFSFPAGTHSVSLRITTADGSTDQVTRQGIVVVGPAAQPAFALLVDKAGAGTGTVASADAGISCGSSCSALLSANTVVTLEATPATGSFFASWSGACTGSGFCQVTMSQARSVTATFELLTATAPIGASPQQAAFGGQSLRTTSPAIPITLTNNAATSLDITAVTVSAPFSATHNCTSLAANASCTVSVTFSPTVDGGAQAAVQVQSSQGILTIAVSGAGERSLTTHYYRSILRRAPDAGGKQYWDSEAQRMQSIGANVNEAWFAMAQFFYFSAEYASFGRDGTGFVTDLYNTFFNRPPDSGGLAFWTGLLAQGMPREVVLASFMFSSEFTAFTQAIFGNTAARAEVDVVMDFYRGLLARLPDAGGFNSWVAQFRQAQCAGAGAVYEKVESISSAFAGSPEYIGKARTNGQYVGDLYNAFLRRGGELQGVQYWVDQIGSGARSREDVRKYFVASPEFNGRVNAMIAQGCLN